MVLYATYMPMYIVGLMQRIYEPCELHEIGKNNFSLPFSLSSSAKYKGTLRGALINDARLKIVSIGGLSSMGPSDLNLCWSVY